MKKGISLLAGFYILLLISGCVTAGPVERTAVSGADDLDPVIREASDYLNKNIPAGSKIVILSIEAPASEASDYILDELIANAVNDGVFTVVDRAQLDAIRAEQIFQLSGEVADSEAQAIGKFFGAEAIVSGSAVPFAGGYRMTLRALGVETAEVLGQFNRNIASSPVMDSLLGRNSARGGASGTAALAMMAAGEDEPGEAAPVRRAQPELEPAITGIVVPGTSFAEKLIWLTRSADSGNTYILEVTADESVEPHVFEYRGAEDITIVIRGDTSNRTLSLASNGEMFIVHEGVTLVLDRNITLKGRPNNNRSLIFVSRDAMLKMRTGSAVTDNTNIQGGPGGIHMDRAVFEMTGGSISGNTGSAGGVYQWRGSFTMWGGTISGNTATGSGGGIHVYYLTTTIRGGTITGNTARERGGGVYVDAGSFVKTGGIITGYSSDPDNGNAVIDAEGYALARRGHAVSHEYLTNADPKRRETTLGEGTPLDSGNDRGWD